MMYWYKLVLLMMSTCCSKHVKAWNKYCFLRFPPDRHTRQSPTRVYYTRWCIDNLVLLMMSTCCSKHVEAWNKYAEKSVSSWSLTRIMLLSLFHLKVAKSAYCIFRLQNQHTVYFGCKAVIILYMPVAKPASTAHSCCTTSIVYSGESLLAAVILRRRCSPGFELGIVCDL